MEAVKTYLDTEAQRNGGLTPIKVPDTFEIGGNSFNIYWARLIFGNRESLLTTNARHSVWEVEYAFRNRLGISVGDKNLTLSEGEFIIISPDTTHQITRSEKDGVKFILGFGPDDGGSNGKIDCSREILNETRTIRGLVENIAVSSFEGSLGEELLKTILRAICLAFLTVALPEEHIYRSAPATSENELLFRRFAEYVDRSTGVGITVGGAAKYVNVSERQLFRICMNASGKTAGELIHQRRLRYIVKCLDSTPLSLCEIADLCGFQTEYAMTKFYKKYKGVTPSDYRKNNASQK